MKNVPALRFVEFSDDWSIMKLNIFALINPKAPKLPETFVYIDLESVEKGILGKEQVISLAGSPSRAQRLLRKHDILYQTVRPYQKNNLFFEKDGDYVASTGYAQIRAKGSARFLYQYLHTNLFVDKVLLRCTGTSYPAINSSDLENIPIGCPSLPEQQKIASFLTAVDDKIQQLSSKKTLLEQYKKGVMQQIFSQEIRFKPDRTSDGDDQGNEYLDWEEKTLGEVGDTFNGLTGKTKENFGAGYPYVTYKQIFDDSKIDVNKFQLVDVSNNESQTMVKFGDVFFTTSSETANEIGYASVLLEEVERLYLNSFCFGYRVHSFEAFSPNYARYLFRSPSFRKDIMKLAQGSTRYNMSKVGLMKQGIKLPSLPEQNKIANFLSAIDSKIDSVNQQIEQSRQFKNGLLQQMFV